MKRAPLWLVLGLCWLGTGSVRAQADPVEAPSLLVTTLADDSTDTDGLISLREAIEYVNSGNAPADPIILFAPGLSGTITLNGTELEIDADATILGPTDGSTITVSGDFSSRVFNVGPSAQVSLSDLTVFGGVTFSAASPATSGGGIINQGFLFLRRCVINKNGSFGGGGLLNVSGFALIDSCTFSSNQSSMGGAIASLGGVAFIQNSTFLKNSADDGGGIINYSSTIDVTNCTFSANKALFQGGAINNDDALTLNNNTFVGNTAGYDGGALYNLGGSGSNETAQLANNIFVAASSPTSTNLFSDSSGYPIVSLGHNVSSDNASLDLNASGDLNSKNAKLGPLQNNGGGTLTYAVTRTSPAFNGGDTSLVPLDFFDRDNDADQSEPNPFDQRGEGFPRVDGSAVDIGAFELFNNPPTNDAVTPASGSSLSGTARTLSVTYSDLDGAADMTEFRLLVNDTPNETNALCAIYDRTTKRISLLSDDGTTRLGNFPQGSNNVISNSQGSINCKSVTFKNVGNSTTVIFNFTPTPGFAGAKNLYGQVTDAGGKTDAYEDLGDWTVIAKVPPVDVSVTPAAGHSVAGSPRLLTAVYSDADGATDITEARLLVGATAAGPNSLGGVYDRASKKLYLLGDDGTTLLGGYLAGTTNVINNSQGSLNCKNSTVVLGTNTLTIGWSFTPINGFTGAQNLYAQVKDKDNAQDGPEDMGDWSIDANSAPTNTSITPASSTTVIGKRRDFNAVYSDANGAADIAEVRMLVNDTANPANSLCAIYNAVARKIYLLDDDGVTRKGGFAPGTANVISNSQGSISCQSIVPRLSGRTLTMNWNLTPIGSFIGTKNMYCTVADKAGALDDYEDLGDWIIKAAPASVQTVKSPSAGGS